MGIDLVDVVGFADQLSDGASGFVEATFTAAEQAAAGWPAGDLAPRRLAARFAAKEAFVKAWAGGNHGRAPALDQVDLREVEVRQDGFGRPVLELHGAVRGAVADAGIERWHVSLTHDGPMAGAVVVVEGPGPQA